MTDTSTYPSAGLPGRVDRIIGAVIDGVGAVTAWTGLALVLVVAGNVLLRYVFNTGTVAMQELEWHLVPPIALFGMAFGLRNGAHVRVDFLYDRLPPRVTALVDLFAALLMVALSFAVILLAIPYVQQSLGMLEGSPDPGGLPYRWILKAFIPAGFACLGLQAIAQALKAWMTLVQSTGKAAAFLSVPHHSGEAAAAS